MDTLWTKNPSNFANARQPVRRHQAERADCDVNYSRSLLAARQWQPRARVSGNNPSISNEVKREHAQSFGSKCTRERRVACANVCDDRARRAGGELTNDVLNWV